MRFSFHDAGARWLTFSVIVALAATFGFAAGKFWLAEHWEESSDRHDWERAAWLEPGNADYWYRLGRFRQLDLAQGDLPQAIANYRRAIAIDPHSADYWMDLGSAYEMAGEATQARQAFEAARSVYPLSAEVAWRYGNFLLRNGQIGAAFAEIRRAVAGDPSLAPLAVSRCWQASRDIERILNEALPAGREVYLPAVAFFVGEHEPDAALAAWKRLLALRRSLGLRHAFPLIDELIRQNRVEDAQQVWQQAFEAAGRAGQEVATNSLIWDGGFEAELTNGGFGWRQQDAPGVTFDFDTEVRHSGARALRVTFGGVANLDFSHLVQLVAVQPRTRYRFGAWMRTQDLSTDSGVRFQIIAPKQPGDVNVWTPNVVGTQDWVFQRAEFTTGAQTRLIQISLRRLPSQKLDNKIRGTVWLDDIFLAPLPTETSRPQP